MAIHTPQDT